MINITITSESNGIQRGWSVEPAYYSEQQEPCLRFIIWSIDEPDEDGERLHSIEYMVELDTTYIKKHLRPRAGFKPAWLCEHLGIERFESAPILRAITEQERRAAAPHQEA